jgi:AraC-like DNA-binding protein
MAGHFHLDEAPYFVTELRPDSALAMTRLDSKTAPGIPTSRIPQESAFVFEWQLGRQAGHELWARGAKRHDAFGAQGSIHLVDLENDHVAYLDTPFDCVHFYLSRSAIDAIAMEYNVSRVTTLKCPRGTIDATISCLGNLLLTALEPDGNHCKLFRDSVLSALAAHLARAYGGVQMLHHSLRGRLAPWQVKRATELLMANIEGDISLAALAAECQLSASHFARAFKMSTGKAPHRWLIEQRMGRSKVLLSHREMSLAEIALQCGFSEQATFSRTFKREVGTSPGVWRRLYRS